MDRGASVIHTRKSDDRTAGNPITNRYGHRAQVGVRRPHHATVIDSDGEDARYRTGKGDGSRRGGGHRGPLRCGQIHTPVTPVVARRGEAGDHSPGNGWSQQAGKNKEDRGEHR